MDRTILSLLLVNDFLLWVHFVRKSYSFEIFCAVQPETHFVKTVAALDPQVRRAAEGRAGGPPVEA